jgi:lysyl endopeptidase
MSRLLILTICFFIFSQTSIYAQISEGGQPECFSIDIPKPKPTEIQAPDFLKINQEDAENPIGGRFSSAITTNITTENTGNWTTLPSGKRIWRASLSTNGAKGLLLFFKNCQIPTGAKLFVFDAQNKQILGAYTQKSLTPEGNLMVGIIKGEAAEIEYSLPENNTATSNLNLSRIDYVYDESQVDPAGLLDFGDSKPCNVNINCPAAANLQTEKRGIARILMVFAGGSAWCSGSLMANTAGSADPFFLSAQHCEIILPNPDFSLWRFDFAYESADCNNPSSEPIAKSVLGCTKVAARMETDLLLLKLNPIPTNYNVWYNGWNREATVTGATTFIHHPKGDIKKFSADNDAPIIHDQTLNWGGQYGISAINTHYKVIPETGIYESGSSGCPLFDANKRIIGQLHGGNALSTNPCVILGAYFGRFNLSWSSGNTPATRLIDWLDPLSTGAMTQNGYTPPVPPPPPPVPQLSIKGSVKTHWSATMPNVKVQLSNTLTGNLLKSTRTDAAGNFKFDSLPQGINYTITPERDSNDLNGVTTFDLLSITKHLLDLAILDSPWKIISADANKSNSVSTFDVVAIRKTILGITPEFPSVNSWRFFPANSTFTDPMNPFPTPQEYLNVPNLQANVIGIDFFGVKMGDTNNSADGNN